MTGLMLSDELWSTLQEIMLQHGMYDKPNLRRKEMTSFYVYIMASGRNGALYVGQRLIELNELGNIKTT